MKNEGQYIWDLEALVQWDYDDSMEDAEREDFTICAPTFDSAIAKTKRIALSPSRAFDLEEEVNGKLKKYTHKPVTIEIVKCERGSRIDG